MPLHQPSNVSPSDLNGTGTIDATQDMEITWRINGSGNIPLTAYEIIFMKNDTASTLLYRTGKMTLEEPFYGADALGNPIYFTATVSAATLAAAGIVNEVNSGYKYYIRQWWNATDNIEQTNANVFITRNAPQIAITNLSDFLTDIEYTFTGQYTQAQGDPIEWIRWQITEAESGAEIVDTGYIYNVGPIETTYNGFLNGITYNIRLDGSTINGVAFDTGWQAFNVAYDNILADGTVQACARCDTDAVQVTIPSLLYTYGEATGDPLFSHYLYRMVSPTASATVTDALAADITNITAAITPVQAGSGDPAPDNVRPISGFTQCVITLNGQATTLAFPSAAGTVYKGYVDASRGVLHVQYALVDLGSLTWRYYAPFEYYTASVPGRMQTHSEQMVCDCYTYSPVDPKNMPNYCIRGANRSDRLYVKDDRFGGSASAFTAAMAGHYVVSVLETPLEYPLTQTTFATVAGNNTISASTGDISFFYAYGKNNYVTYLNLPTAADGAVWGSAENPLAYVPQYTLAWSLTVGGYASSGIYQLTVQTQTGTLKMSIWPNGVRLAYEDYVDAFPYQFTGNERVLCIVTEGVHTVYIYQGTDLQYQLSRANEGIFSSPMVSIAVAGPQNCENIWVVNGTMTDEQRVSLLNHLPVFDASTLFLARFQDGLQSGSFVGSEELTQIVVYRRRAGQNYLKYYAQFPPQGGTVTFRDYAALNGATYKYYIYGRTATGMSSYSFSSNEVSPLFWNHTVLVCEEAADGSYHVQNEYRFALDVSSGTGSNNNKPTLQANFTPYPTRQPTTQNYRSSTLTAYAARNNNGTYVDSLTEITQIREMSTNANPKFLKTRKGELIRIETSDPITLSTGDKYRQQPVRVGIPWAEVGESGDVNIVTTPEDSYWNLT